MAANILPAICFALGTLVARVNYTDDLNRTVLHKPAQVIDAEKMQMVRRTAKLCGTLSDPEIKQFLSR